MPYAHPSCVQLFQCKFSISPEHFPNCLVDFHISFEKHPKRLQRLLRYVSNTGFRADFSKTISVLQLTTFPMKNSRTGKFTTFPMKTSRRGRFSSLSNLPNVFSTEIYRRGKFLEIFRYVLGRDRLFGQNIQFSVHCVFARYYVDMWNSLAMTDFRRTFLEIINT